MTTDTLILGLIIAAFSSFAAVLFCVSIYVRLDDRRAPAKRALSQTTAAPADPPKPARDHRLAA